jgi:hypothetical protein
MKRFVGLGLLIALSVSLVGCGADTATVSTVPLKLKVVGADGKPVSDVKICLGATSAKCTPGDFVLDANGTPIVGKGSSDMAPAKYAVHFAAAEPKTPADASKFAKAFKAIPEKYTKQGMTGLEINIDGSEQTIELK